METLMTRLARSAGVALAGTPGLALAQEQAGGERYVWGPHGMWWDGGWYGMFFGPLFMIVFLVALVAVVVLVVRWLGGSSYPAAPSPPVRTPLDILKERFARGEIDKAEYEERRRVLGE